MFIGKQKHDYFTDRFGQVNWPLRTGVLYYVLTRSRLSRLDRLLVDSYKPVCLVRSSSCAAGALPARPSWSAFSGRQHIPCMLPAESVCVPDDPARMLSSPER